MKSIVIYYGNQKSESYNLEQFQKEVVSFGRQPDNDIVLDLEFVSRIHGVFYMEEGIWYVQDLNSTNGILVNGNRVEQYAIEEGDCICIQGKDSEESISIYIGGGKEAKGNKTKSKKKLVIILSVVCVLLAGLIVSLIVYAKHRDSSKKDTATPTDASTEAEAERQRRKRQQKKQKKYLKILDFPMGNCNIQRLFFQVEQGHGRQICPLMQMGISQVCFMIARWEIPEKDIQVDQSILVNSSDGLDS